MNLQDKNLLINRIENESRLLKSLGLSGLFISGKKRTKLNNLINNYSNRKEVASKVKVLFVCERSISKNSLEGELFSNIISKGMNLKEEEVAVLDAGEIYKESSSSNLDMADLLEKEIKSCAPIVIISLGEKNSQLILDTTDSLLDLRNNFFNICNVKLMCTLDLNTLIKDASKKKLVWEDIKMVNKEINNAE